MPHCMWAGSGPGSSPRADRLGRKVTEATRAQRLATRARRARAKGGGGLPEPPGEPSESPTCDEVQTATTGATVAQAIGGQGEAEACETPLPWEEEYDDDMTTEEDGRLDWEVGQHLWGSDWEDDEDFLDLQRSHSGREHGDDADSGWRAATCGATQVMATRSATRAQEEAAQMVRAAGPRDEEERAA